MDKFAQRCAREDEEDRLSALYAKRDEADRLTTAIETLMGLKDDGVISGWHISFPDRGETS